MNWHQYFLAIAKVCSLRSKDPNTKVGACIINNDNQIVSTGYNGLPKGFEDGLYPWNKSEGDIIDVKYTYVIHAEMNAILTSKRNLEGYKLYSTFYPCSNCAKTIAQVGIKEIYYISDKYKNTPDNKAAKKIINDANIKDTQIQNIDVKVTIN